MKLKLREHTLLGECARWCVDSGPVVCIAMVFKILGGGEGTKKKGKGRGGGEGRKEGLGSGVVRLKGENSM